MDVRRSSTAGRRSSGVEQTQSGLVPDRGAVAGEYAVLMTLIALALIITIEALTDGIVNTLQAVINVLP